MKIEFENLLRCPITSQPLRHINAQELATLNQRIAANQIKNRSGEVHQTSLQAALQVSCEDVFYPIIDGILCLLQEMALQGNFNQKAAEGVTELTKAKVKKFYDDFGWKEEKGIYQDAKDSEDLREVSHEYIQRCHERVNQHLPSQGTYLLDVASGPIQYPAYLRYSEHFKYRICADISLRALKEAKKKLEDKGVYILCDITRLPLNEEVVDAVVSLHTLYHVPAQEQLKAYKEINRVLKKGGTSVVVYSWGGHSFLMNVLLLPMKAYTYLKRKMMPKMQEESLYFHAHTYRWYYRELKHNYRAKLYAWRSVNVPFLKTYIHPKLAGRFLLKCIFWLENHLPHTMGRIGAYPLFVYKK